MSLFPECRQTTRRPKPKSLIEQAVLLAQANDDGSEELQEATG